MSKKVNNIFNFIKSLESFQKVVHQSGPAASASYSLIASVLIFTFLGIYIDTKYNSSPVGVLIGIAIGLVIGFYSLYKFFYFKKN